MRFLTIASATPRGIDLRTSCNTDSVSLAGACDGTAVSEIIAPLEVIREVR